MSTSRKSKSVPVDVWTIALFEHRELILSPEEQARAARFRQAKHCLHWGRCHSALRVILSSYLKVPPLEIQFTANFNGKPLVDGIHFNLSHADDYAMIAFSKACAVGIDVERFRPNVDMALLLERLGETDLPMDDPPALHQRWTRREAASKACGGALFEPVDPNITVVDLQAPAGHFASLGIMSGVPSITYCGVAGVR